MDHERLQHLVSTPGFQQRNAVEGMAADIVLGEVGITVMQSRTSHHGPSRASIHLCARAADMGGELVATMASATTPGRGVLRRCFWPPEQPVRQAAPASPGRRVGA